MTSGTNETKQGEGSGGGGARVRGGFLKDRHLGRDWQEVEEGRSARRRNGTGRAAGMSRACAGMSRAGAGMSCACAGSSKEAPVQSKGRKGRRELPTQLRRSQEGEKVTLKVWDWKPLEGFQPKHDGSRFGF